MDNGFIFKRDRIEIKKFNLIGRIERIKNVDRHSMYEIDVYILEYTSEITFFRFNGFDFAGIPSCSIQFFHKMAVQRGNYINMGIKRVESRLDIEIDEIVEFSKLLAVVFLAGNKNAQGQYCKNPFRCHSSVHASK